MKRLTVAQVCKQVVLNSIDRDYIKECGHTTVSAVYKAEYGYNGLSDKSCHDYLQGLPSVCTVPFYNGEILELMEKNGITRKSENARYGLIEKYWRECGKALHKIIREENEKE